MFFNREYLNLFNIADVKNGFDYNHFNSLARLKGL